MSVVALLFICVLFILAISCISPAPIEISSSQRYVLEREFFTLHYHALLLLLGPHICYLELKLVLPRFSYGLLTLFGHTLWASDSSAPSLGFLVFFAGPFLISESDAGINLQQCFLLFCA